MEELSDFSWSYTIPDKPNFISDQKLFETSAIYKITTDNFVDPLLSSSDEEKIPSKIQKPSKLIEKSKTIKKPKNSNICGYRKINKLPQTSCLNIEEHKLGTQMIRYFNKQITSIPPVNIKPGSFDKYEALIMKVQSERNSFFQFAKSSWENNLCKRVANINTDIDKFVEYVWNEKVKKTKIYSQFYDMVGSLPLVYMNDSNPIQVSFIKTLESVPMENLPTVNFKTPTQLNDKFDVVCEHYIQHKKNSVEKCLVSADRKCEEFAQLYNADIVISLSSLKKLSDTYPPYNKQWDLPISIQNYQIHSNNKSINQNVVYIDQPLPSTKSNCLEKTHWYYKKLMKLKMLKNNRKNVKKREKTVTLNKNTVKSVDSPNKSFDNSNSEDDDDEDKLVIMEENDAQKPKQTSQNENISRAVCSEKEEIKKYNYHLWKIGQSNDEKLSKLTERPLNILIRCRSEAKEIVNKNEAQEIILMPKIEHQYEYGMEATTSSEAAISWTNLYFRPRSQLLRTRIYPHSGESVLVEKVPLKVVQTEAQNCTDWKPQMALGCYFSIFNILKKYKPGQYLLKHDPKHHAFAVLYETTSIEKESSYNMYKAFDIKYDETMVYSTIPWNPLDPNVINPNFFYQGIMPCMFTPGKKRKRLSNHKNKNKSNTFLKKNKDMVNSEKVKKKRKKSMKNKI